MNNSKEKYKFISDVGFKSGDSGKIILYINGNSVHLGASKTRCYEKKFPSDFSDEEILEYLGGIGMQLGIDEKVGRHMEITHNGNILGGSHFVVREDRFLIAGRSNDFGAIHPEGVQKCLEGLGLKVRYTPNSYSMPETSIDDYLKLKGEK